MTIGIKDRLLFQLTINDKEVNLQQNTLDFFHLVESVRLHLPMMTLQIKDTTKYFSKNDVLVDGAKIRVTVGIDGKKIIFPMRMFNHKETTQEGSQMYAIYAYLDVPEFWTSSMVASIRSTSAGALRSICADTGLTYEGVDTNDQQLWIPYNRKCTEFTKYIAQRAYINDQSCCQMGVTTAKKMRMINVSEFDKFPVRQVFNNAPTAGQSQITDWKLINKAGFFNSVSGYQDQQISQSVIKDDVIIKEAQVTRNTKKLMMSRDVKSQVTQNRVTYAPIDVGNVNENYERARYQNERLGNFFSTGVEFVTPAYVDADIMDVVNVQLSRPGAEGITAVSGKYMITSKVFYIVNNNFYQKLEVFRHGLNDKQANTQTG